MVSDKGNIIINNTTSDPVGDYVFDYLLAQTKETPYHDFKSTLSIAKDSQDFPKIIKDVYAFSNHGGGWLFLGVQENDHSDTKIKGKYIKTGLTEEYNLEDASLQEKINAFLVEPIEIQYAEFIRTVDNDKRKFALIYFPPSSKIMTSKVDVKYKVGNKEKIAVQKDKVYTRRGTQCIIASDYEKDLIKKRLEKEEYRLSILSGEPDDVDEILYSNMFMITKLPDTIYLGKPKYSTFQKSVEAIRIACPHNPHAWLSYIRHGDRIVTLTNLNDNRNVHLHLVHSNTITQESVNDWLEDKDKEKIIIGLLNNAITHPARRQGMKYDKKSSSLYYPINLNQNERIEKWDSRHKKSNKKQVVKKKTYDAIKRTVYLHEAIRISIMKIDTELYLRLNPTKIITKDGKTPVRGIEEGAIITRESYNIYNKGQLNLILFWINKLVDVKNMPEIKDFEISKEPIQTSIETGISWDIPVADFKQIIEEFDADVQHMEEKPESEEYYKDYEVMNNDF